MHKATIYRKPEINAGGTMTAEGRMISEDALIKGHAFSFSDQPYLRDLFDTIFDREIPITFVVGAGVSMDASLPSWYKLIDNICGQIPEDHFRTLARNDRADLMRKAEFVLEMAKKEGSRKTSESIVRDALYGKNPAAFSPGPLAEAIVRLGTALGTRARLLTTNFDTMIESALRRYSLPAEIKSISLKEESRKKSWSNQSPVGIHNVLHVHGIVASKGRHGKPVVLSESQFLEHGPEVRKIIREQLGKTCVIFIGVSVSDPNLTGPLWDARLSELGGEALPRKPFVLDVPAPVTSTDCSDHEGKRYALRKARYLEQKLNMRPIFLKSYAQLVQVLWDLDLGLAAPGRYVTSCQDGKESLAYGNRFKRKLDACYAAIGYDAMQSSLSYENAQKLNSSLHTALFKGDVGRILDRLIARHDRDIPTRENFGIFLWLRAWEHDLEKAPYAIDLIGTSTYVHRDAWSGSKQVPIVADSKFPAARALFLGTMLTGEPPKRNSPFAVWLGMLAKPIRIKNETCCTPSRLHGLDTVVVGAVTLNTTKYTEKDQHPNALKDELSVLCRTTQEEVTQLGALLEKAAQDILGIS
jgi:hypothetical protein